MATRIYKTPFAATGDKEALATVDQPDGKVSLQAGWTPDYELPNDNPNYRPVGRAEMNGVVNEITEGLGEMQLNGFAKWQAIDGGWPRGAHVLHNGAVYVSTDDSNVTEPGPASSTWSAPFRGGTLKFIENGTFTVPQGIGIVYLTGCGAGGGGGGGGGSSSTTVGVAGGGGGAGRFTLKQPVSVTAGQVLSVVVGGAGLGGVSGTPSVKGGDGLNGGASSFAGVTLQGGSGGKGGTSSVGSGMSDGGVGYPNGGKAAPHSYSPLVYSLGGAGSSCPYGGGGAGGASSSGAPSAGGSGYGYGAGGGGGGGMIAVPSGNGTAGGNGSPGLVMLEW